MACNTGSAAPEPASAISAGTITSASISKLAVAAMRVGNLARDARTPGRFRLFLRSLEPWYDWGTINTFRMDALTEAEADDSEGEVYRFEIQWLGFHFGVQFGRTPAKAGGAA